MTEFSYWMGLILADGCVSDHHGNTRLSITLKDHDMVTSIARFLGFEKNVYNQGKYKRLNVVRKNFGIDFKRYGIVPNKTANFIRPQLSADEVIDFLRGWFDGDGHRDYKKHRFMIHGNIPAMNFYQEQLHEAGYDGNSYFYEIKNGFYRSLVVSGRLQVSRVIDLLKGTPCLERKWHGQEA